MLGHRAAGRHGRAFAGAATPVEGCEGGGMLRALSRAMPERAGAFAGHRVRGRKPGPQLSPAEEAARAMDKLGSRTRPYAPCCKCGCGW